MRFAPLLAALATLALAGTAAAGTPAVTAAKIKKDAREVTGIYQITVTVQHQDTGWDNYVDAWQIVAPDGDILGTRIIFEPRLDKTTHVTGLAGVVIPEEIKEVTIRAHNVAEGYSGQPLTVRVPH